MKSEIGLMNSEEQQQQQEGLTPPESHVLVTETTLRSPEHKCSPQATSNEDSNTNSHQSHPSPDHHLTTSHHYPATSDNHSSSPHHNHHNVSYCSSPDTPNSATDALQIQIQARTENSATGFGNNEEQMVESEGSINDMHADTVKASGQVTTHTHNTQITTTTTTSLEKHYQKSGSMEDYPGSERKSDEVPLDLTQSFSVVECVEGRQHNTPAKCSPHLEHRTPPTASV